MQRVAVLGCSGSGKTTLAQQLANVIGAEHIELDSIFHQAGWQPLPDDDFRAEVLRRTSANRWVACGNYTAVRDIVLGSADTVVMFDLPRAVVMQRLLRRTFRRMLRREALWNGNRESLGKVLALWDPERSIIAWAWTQHRRYHDELAVLRASNTVAGKRVFVVTKPSETRLVLEAAAR